MFWLDHSELTAPLTEPNFFPDPELTDIQKPRNLGLLNSFLNSFFIPNPFQGALKPKNLASALVREIPG
jgi:hypothetical protein